MWLLFVVLAVIASFVFVGFFQWLWNITMPDIFACKPVSYWQRFRLLIIAQILFGSAALRFDL